MPQTSAEHRARWPGWDSQAVAYLQERGFVQTPDWRWIAPREKLTAREADAIDFLVMEFDWGGIAGVAT